VKKYILKNITFEKLVSSATAGAQQCLEWKQQSVPLTRSSAHRSQPRGYSDQRIPTITLSMGHHCRLTNKIQLRPPHITHGLYTALL